MAKDEALPCSTACAVAFRWKTESYPCVNCSGVGATKVSSAVVIASETSAPAATGPIPAQPPAPPTPALSAGMRRRASHAPAAAMAVPKSSTGRCHGRPIRGAVMALAATTETETAGARNTAISARTRNAMSTAAPGRAKISSAAANAGSASNQELTQTTPS